MRNWGRWGPEDELGTLNLIDEEARRRAAASVVSGRAFALGLPMSESEGIQIGAVEGRIDPSVTVPSVRGPDPPAPLPRIVTLSYPVLLTARETSPPNSLLRW